MTDVPRKKTQVMVTDIVIINWIMKHCELNGSYPIWSKDLKNHKCNKQNVRQPTQYWHFVKNIFIIWKIVKHSLILKRFVSQINYPALPTFFHPSFSMWNFTSPAATWNIQEYVLLCTFHRGQSIWNIYLVHVQRFSAVYYSICV